METRNPKRIGRRSFLGTAAGLALAATGVAGRVRVPEAWRSQVDLFVINMLGGIRNPNRRGSRGPLGGAPADVPLTLDERAPADARASGTTAINTTIGYVAGPQDPFEFSVADVTRWNRIIRAHREALLKVRASRDIERAKREGKVGIIQGFQNAAMMGDDPQRVAVVAGLGVKIIQTGSCVWSRRAAGSSGSNSCLSSRPTAWPSRRMSCGTSSTR